MLIDKIEVFGARCKSYVLESILKASIQIGFAIPREIFP